MADTQLLKQWVNPLYLLPETITQAQKTFNSHKHIRSIQLGQFFLAEKAEKIRKTLEKCSWNHAYIPHMYSYAILTNEKPLKEFYALLSSPGFKSLVGTMLKKQIKTVQPHALCFCHKDYTLLHDTIEERDYILCTFDFTKEWPENAAAQMIFTYPETDPLIFSTMFNAVNIVHITNDVHSFVKYVNCNAGKKKKFLIEVNME